jgi:hypothetical protein
LPKKEISINKSVYEIKIDNKGEKNDESKVPLDKK